MARLVREGSGRDRSGDGDVVRSWDAETGDFAEYPGGHQGFKEQAEQALDLLLRRKWLIILTCLLVVGGVAVYTYTQVPVYRTSTLVLVEQEQERSFLSGAEGPSAGTGSLMGQGNRSIQNELVVLRNSQSLRRRVAQRLIDQGKAGQLLGSTVQSPLGRLSDQAWASVRRLLGAAGGPEENQNASQESQEGYTAAEVAAALAGHVRFAPSEQADNAIRITASDENPELAATLANLYSKEYVRFARKSSRSQVSASRRFLEKQAKQRKQKLRAIERKIQAYKRRQEAVSLSNEGSSLVGRISQTEASLEEARVKLKMQRRALKSLKAQLDSIRPDQMSQRVGSSLRKQIEALQSKIADLELSKQELMLQSGAPTPADSAQIEQIDRRIQDLRAKVSALSDKYTNEVLSGGLSAEAGAQRVADLRRQISKKRVRITGLKSRIDVLSNRLQEYEAELNKIPKKSMQLAQLKRRRSYAKQMYEFINKRLQKARIQVKSELGYASSVSEAAVPGRPVRPRPRRNLFWALVLGLIGGIGLALGRDKLDNRVYKPDRLNELGYRELGIVPNLTPLIEDQLGGQTTVEHDGNHFNTSLVTVVKPNSAAAEAYRQVRTRVQHSQPDEPREALLVTSPGAGDGKSVTAANLAVVTAQSGRSTLLLDTDLRRPRIHKLFGMSRSPGLMDAMNATLEEHLKTPAIDNLFVLPVGTTNGANPTEVLSSSRFREFLHVARKHFDSVVMDTSPVLATTDASLLSTHSDTTLCVVRAGRTTESELDRAMETLSDVGARVTGVVFNGFDVSMAYGYKYRYRYYGEYGPYDQYASLPDSAEEERS
ncbi:MAG: GumC family protein [Salinibacter sp.]|uniref:GumC family protein n=1 Tax=Salinibacter sp. TaxID=2065818 RepID=UPI0035D3EB3B